MTCISAGVIFYQQDADGRIKFLLQRKFDSKKKRTYLEDLGGSSIDSDIDICDVAAREAAEESNAQLLNLEFYHPIFKDYYTRLRACREYVYQLIKTYAKIYINRRSKYALFVVRLPGASDYDFGGYEIHPNKCISRRIEWIYQDDLTDLPVVSLHPRIRHVYNLLVKH